MSLKCSCPSCGKSYRVGEEQAGRTATCRQCGSQFDVPPADETIQAPEIDRTIAPSRAERSPLKLEKVGRFEIREKVGLGGFGAVYRAFDPLLGREVALKVPHASRIADEKDRARTLREAKASAQLFHPNIVPVFDAGTDGDRFFIASAFIEGNSLQAQLEEEEFSFADSARIVMQLALALEYAHHQGIVHRDIKPGNVMLTEDREPKLMDFGLARLEEAETQLTQEGAIMGTPAFMPPEQARGSHSEVGPASDQYSLGVMLYRFLCGQTPFSGPLNSVIYLVVNEEPPAPSSHRDGIPKDLETICLKAMSKSPAERYPNCGLLAADLRRWLDGEPILARPLGALERFTRWRRKNPALAALAATSLVLLLTVAVVASVAYVQTSRALAVAETERGRAEDALEKEKAALGKEKVALEEAVAERKRAEDALVEKDKALTQEAAARKEADAERKRAEEARRDADQQREIAVEKQAEAERVRKEAEDNLYVLNLAFAHQYLLAENFSMVEKHLDACAPELRAWEWEHLMYRFHHRPKRRGSRSSAVLRIKAHSAGVSCARISPDCRWIATGSSDRTVNLWNAIDGELLRRRTTMKSAVSDMAFSPDGSLLAVSLFDGSVHVLAVDTDKDTVIEAHDRGLCGVAFSPDGDWIVAGSGRGTIGLYDPKYGVPVRQFREVDRLIRKVAVSPDGQWIAAAGMIWPADGSAAEDLLVDDISDFKGVAFSPDGDLVAWAAQCEVVVSNRETRELQANLCGHNSDVTSVAFSPDGRRIGSGCDDGTIKVGSVETGRTLITFSEHTESVNAVEFSHDGTYVVSCSSDGTANVFKTDSSDTVGPISLTGRNSVSLPGGHSVHFSQDSRQVTVARGGDTMRWDLTDPHCLPTVDISIPESKSFQFNADATRAACHIGEETLIVWDVESAKEIFRSDPPDSEWRLGRFQISPAGDRIVALHYNHIDAGQLRYVATIGFVSSGRNTVFYESVAETPPFFEFSHEGGQIAFWAGPSAPIRLINANSGEDDAREAEGRNEVVSMLFSPDGEHLLIADSSRRYLLDNPSGTGELVVAGTMRDRRANNDAVFNSNGTLIAAITDFGLRIFRTDSFPEAIAIPADAAQSPQKTRLVGHFKRVFAFTPDGKRLATVGSRDLHVWDAMSGDLIGQRSHRGLSRFGWSNRCTTRFSPDGHWLVDPNWAIRCIPDAEHQVLQLDGNVHGAIAEPNTTRVSGGGSASYGNKE